MTQKVNVGACGIGRVGKRLFHVAVDWSQQKDPPGTIRDREARIKSMRGRQQIVDGSRSMRAARLACESIAREVLEARHRKLKIRGADPLDTPIYARLEVWRRRLAMAAFDRCGYRTNSAGKLQIEVGPPSVSQESRLDWDYYPSSTKYPKKVTDTRIAVAPGWIADVYRAGISEADGLLTLAATEVAQDASDVRVWDAHWLMQGRGYALQAQRGYIAEVRDARGLIFRFHASTPSAAICGARRKRQATADAGDRRKTRTGSPQSLSGLAALSLSRLAVLHPDLIVRVSDARATGSCYPGIQSWCQQNNLPYRAGEASLREVWRAYQSNPRPEVLLAIRHAARRLERQAA